MPFPSLIQLKMVTIDLESVGHWVGYRNLVVDEIGMISSLMEFTVFCRLFYR